MTMPPDDRSATPPDDGGAAASAWLAGDLDPAAAAAFEAAVAADPAAASRLEAVADTILRLRTPDTVPPPPGYATRLRARLAAERTDPAAAPTAGGMAARGHADGEADATHHHTTPGHANPTDATATADPEADATHHHPTPGHANPTDATATADRETDATRHDGRPGAEARPAGRVGAGAGAGVRPAGRVDAGGPGRRRRVNAAVLSAAALGLVAVVSLAAVVGWLPGVARDSSDEAALTAEDTALEAEPEAAAPDTFRGGDEEGAAGGEAAEAAGSEAARAPDATAGDTVGAAGGALVTEGLPLALGDDPDAAIAQRFAGDPSARALLATPLTDAADLAAANRAAIAAAGPVGGVDPTACLDDALAGPGPVVPIRVEVLTVDGTPALAHVVALADPESDTLTTVEVRVLAAGTCASLGTVPG